ncbi:MAG: IMP dehydrogenase [Phycisphaeraceae bacterium]|nr:IMP dehydrogenase [Phycisphaerales bacterium]MCB9860152.1 IMP dehydrogenase [Phycisphaeraceae bacterium]
MAALSTSQPDLNASAGQYAGPSGGLVGAGKVVQEGITFDDVLLIPRASSILPANASTRTRLTNSITLNIPLLSAPMDTVTESALAIALALEGGIGIIHKNLPIEAQAREVAKVKRSANGIITDPITLGPTTTVGRARELMRTHGVSGFPVVADGDLELRTHGKLMGILTRRDLKFVEDASTLVQDVMTKDGLITASPTTTLQEAEAVLNRNKVEKLLLIDDAGMLSGMVTMRDIERLSDYPNACTDSRGRLRCGGAVGVGQLDRVDALIEAGADVIIVDTAHGHSSNVIETVRAIKASRNIDVIAGNIATAEAAVDLINAGADAIKVGIGPGSICTTRVVTGVGMPQITAVFNAVEGAQRTGKDIPVIADGGIRMSGDIAKAIAAGASCVMLGSLFAGLHESPGELVIHHGRRYKSYRGMGSEGAMNAGSADRYGQADQLQQKKADDRKFVPEGVEGLVAYRGHLAEFVYQLVGGLRAAMGYCGCATLDTFRAEAKFCKVSGATVVENHPHDIRITKESPNYTVEHMPGV